MVALVEDPRPMDGGKSAWHHVQAGCKFFPLLRSKAGAGITISHYSFDRAVFSAAARHMHQRHAVWHFHKQQHDTTGDALDKSLLDWDVATGCANHDCQNSLDWALRPVTAGPKDTVKRLFMVNRSLREAYDLIHQTIDKFVLEKLDLDPSPWDKQEVYSFWVSLGVESKVADELARLNLQWRDRKLWVGSVEESGDALRQQVSGCLKNAYKFRVFTESRWLSVGESCRNLSVALLLGIEGVVDMFRSSGDHSDWYIHGVRPVDRLSEAILSCRRHRVICAGCRHHRFAGGRSAGEEGRFSVAEGVRRDRMAGGVGEPFLG